MLWRPFFLLLVLWCPLAVPLSAQEVQPGAQAGPDIPIVRTEGPGETLASFLALRDALEAAVGAYLAAPDRPGVARIALMLESLRATIDLEPVPAASRRRVGDATVLALLDIAGRVALPDAAGLPSSASFDGMEVAALRLAETPLRLVRIDTGSRAGEWLFEAGTVTSAPRFFAGIAHSPLQPGLAVGTWSETLPMLTGPLVPSGVSAAMPASLGARWGGLPVWKAAILVAATLLAGTILVQVALRSSASARGPHGTGLVRVAPAALMLVFLQILLPGLARELMPFSQMPEAVAFATTLLSFAALAWLFWSGTQALVGLRIRSSRKAERPVNADLLRVLGIISGCLGVLVIVTTGAHRLGLPVVSLAAGLGVGGLAVALAVRPTLENLVGGLLLYVDRPVRVGDFCTFDSHSGTIERIGVRAVEVRALDRTLISIPNARFADMELINWAACDMMLIHTVLRLRFETTADQLRFVLAEIRRMLHAHPRIDDATIRIRYVGPSASGRDIDLRFYARTREWNEFFAIREDAFLRIDGILEAAGARYAVPAQVLHLARDTGGADLALREAAEAQVAAWREAGTLPFPKFAAEELARLDDTLDYPPTGSPDAGTGGYYRAATPETLSQDPQRDPPDRPDGKG